MSRTSEKQKNQLEGKARTKDDQHHPGKPSKTKTSNLNIRHFLKKYQMMSDMMENTVF